MFLKKWFTIDRTKYNNTRALYLEVTGAKLGSGESYEEVLEAMAIHQLGLENVMIGRMADLDSKFNLYINHVHNLENRVADLEKLIGEKRDG